MWSRRIGWAQHQVRRAGRTRCTTYELEFEDTFDGDRPDQSRWLPYYLPHWSSRAAAAARYRVGGYPKEFTVGHVRGYRLVGAAASTPL